MWDRTVGTRGRSRWSSVGSGVGTHQGCEVATIGGVDEAILCGRVVVVVRRWIMLGLYALQMGWAKGVNGVSWHPMRPDDRVVVIPNNIFFFSKKYTQ